jgi:hypothetical protein
MSNKFDFRQTKLSTATDASTTGTATTLGAFGTSKIRLTNASLVSLTGIPAGYDGQVIFIENVTGNTINLLNDVGATSANRIYTGAGQDLQVTNQATTMLAYDSTAARWMVISTSGANTSLSNLTTTSINQGLLPDTTTSRNIGSNLKQWGIGYISQMKTSVDTLSIDVENRILYDQNSTQVLAWNNSPQATFYKTVSPDTNNSRDLGTSSLLWSNIWTYTQKLGGSTSGTLTFKPAAVTTDHTLTMPAAQGLAQTVLTNDGSGNLTWTPSAGGINYVLTRDGSSTTGWTTYKDAAASSPVDGTAGSPTVTYAISTDSTLRGTSNFLFTHAASNQQGEGFSYDFTIDAADKAKMLTIKFDYNVSSGTFADGGLTLWIYDVANAVLIQPAGYSLNNVVGNQSWAATFQTASNSTSYRLIAHVATATATAYTMRFDNWSVGPQSTSYGAAISDWVSYTPTVSNLGSGSGSITGKYRRVGDSAQFQLKFGKDVTAGTGAAVVYFSIPSGMTIDRNKTSDASTSQCVGTALTYSIETASQQGTAAVMLRVGDTTQVCITDTGGVDGYVGTDYRASSSVALQFQVPILGWSSNTIQSSDTDTRVVAFSNSGTPSATITGTLSLLKFTTASNFDTHASYSTSTGLYTTPVSGFYRVVAQAGILASYASGNNAVIAIYKDGAVTQKGDIIVTGAGGGLNIPIVTTTIYCNAGQTIAPYVSTNATTPTILSDSTLTYFTVERISGPATIQAASIVSARYTDNGGATISSANQIIGFNTKDFDTNGVLSGSGATTKVTAPFSTKYRVSFRATTATAATATQYWALKLLKNGTTYVSVNAPRFLTGQTYPNAQITTTLNLLAGEYIQFVIDSSFPNTATLSNSGIEVEFTFDSVGGIV